jgi:hypothetical protein
MSYLSLPLLKMADIKKGVISLWFRVPQDSIDKAKTFSDNWKWEDHVSNPNAPYIFRSTIPLVTFGSKVMAHVYDSKAVEVGTQPLGRDPITGEILGGPIMELQVDAKDDSPCEPSHIGINCSGDYPTLVMHFQTKTRANVQGFSYQITEAHYAIPAGKVEYQYYDTVEDISYTSVGEPESFRIEPDFKIDVDKWHHLLVSFDFSATSSGNSATSVDVVAVPTYPDTEEDFRDQTIKSYCKLWYSFDDENKKGKKNIGRKIPVDDWEGWVARDDNGIIPQSAESAIRVFTPHPPDVDAAGNPIRTGGGANPEYHWEASSALPTEDGPIGFPASKEFVETVYRCELAEFQMWAGITLDTATEKNRRAFVDKDGKPVPPNKTKDLYDPTSTSGSIELLEKTPEVMLHGSGNWKIGNNTGTLGLKIEDDGTQTIIPEGQFVPKGGIEPYSGPALTKPPPPGP